MRPRLLALALLGIAASCGERGPAGDSSGGTVVMAIGGDASALLPPFASDQIAREVSDQLYDRLAEIGPDLNYVGDAGFTPRLARSWAWSKDSLSIAFSLDPRARWHDGQPVRAGDVRFTFELNKDPTTRSGVTSVIANIDSVSTPDSLTAVVWFKRRSPEQFYEVTYQLFILPEHVLGRVPHDQLATSEVARSPIGTGRFRFVRWEPGVRIEIAADTQNYRGRARLDRVIWTIVPDGAAAATQLFSSQSDFLDNLSVDLVPRVDSNPSTKVIRYPSHQYSFMAFNLHDPARRSSPHPVLGDARVRRALTMALDRQAMLRNVFDTVGILGKGPFPTALADSGVHLLPFDRARAGALLDSAGWRVGADGMRAKSGRPLHFTILVPNSSRYRMRYAVLIQEQLKSVGADVGINAVAFPQFVARQDARDFDAVMSTVGPDPAASDVRQYWTSDGAKPGGQNYIGYSSPVFDALVDSTLASLSRARANQYLRLAYQRLVDDAPAVWLYEPPSLAGAHKRLRPEGMRADTWWADLADWWIPANERIDRDRIGLRESRPTSGARP